MERKTFGLRGLISVKHLRVLLDLYEEREKLLREAILKGDNPYDVERVIGERIQFEKARAQKERAELISEPFEHEHGISTNLEVRHAYERKALDELFPPLIAQAIKEGNDKRVEEYNKEYQEKIRLMRRFHNQERENSTNN